MPRTLTKDEQKEVTELFELYDEDKSGFVDTKELGTLLRALHLEPSTALLNELMKRYDEDKNGKISLDELMELAADEKIPKFEMKQDEIEKIFLAFDSDGSGFISREELITALTSMGDKMNPEEVEQTFNFNISANGDGKISLPEFRKFMVADSSVTASEKGTPIPSIEKLEEGKQPSESKSFTNPQLVVASWNQIKDEDGFTLQTLGSLFYTGLFEKAPQLKETHFPDVDIAAQGLTVMKVLDSAVNGLLSLENPTDELSCTLVELGERHAGYGATVEHYTIVGEVLLGVLSGASGPQRFSEELKNAWIEVYEFIKNKMLEGQRGEKGKELAQLYEEKMARKLKDRENETTDAGAPCQDSSNVTHDDSARISEENVRAPIRIDDLTDDKQQNSHSDGLVHDVRCNIADFLGAATSAEAVSLCLSSRSWYVAVSSSAPNWNQWLANLGLRQLATLSNENERAVTCRALATFRAKTTISRKYAFESESGLKGAVLNAPTAEQLQGAAPAEEKEGQEEGEGQPRDHQRQTEGQQESPYLVNVSHHLRSEPARTKTGDNFLRDKQHLLAVCLGNERCALDEIGSDALADCKSLKFLDMGPGSAAVAGIKKIGDNFASGCGGLQSVDLDGLVEVEEIGVHFMMRANLPVEFSLSLPKLEVIPSRFITRISNVVRVDLGGMKQCREIGYLCLSRCYALEEVSLVGMDNLEVIGEAAFFECDNLRMMKLGLLPKLKRIESEAGYDSPLDEIEIIDLPAIEYIDPWSCLTFGWDRGGRKFTEDGELVRTAGEQELSAPEHEN